MKKKKNNLLITVTQAANKLGYSLQPFNPKSLELRKMKNKAMEVQIEKI